MRAEGAEFIAKGSNEIPGSCNQPGELVDLTSGPEHG